MNSVRCCKPIFLFAKRSEVCYYVKTRITRRLFSVEVNMRYLLRQWLRKGTAVLCASAAICCGTTVYAAEIESMEQQTSDLKDELSSINSELLEISSKIADLENEIEQTDNQIAMAQEQLSIAKNSEEQQFEDMKLRIKYVYENDSASMLSMIFAVDNMADFLNRIEFVQNVSDYDRKQLEVLQNLRDTIEEEEKNLQEEQEAQKELESELAEQKNELKLKAEETSTNLEELNSEIAKLKAEEEKKAEEAAKKAEEEKKAAQADKNQSSSSSSSSSSGSSSSGSSGSSSSGGGYDYPSGSGVLTPEKGVNYFNGHRETYYSQKVLPGYGLNIPGRHVASDGTIRDKDGYICVASSDYPKGTVVETSLGPGKVYDTGCASGTIDIYTDW